MKRIMMLFVSLSFICPSSLARAQAGGSHTPFSQAFDFVQQGKLDLAISVLQAEVNAHDRTDAERGRAYSLLGYAYKEQGRFELADKAFDHALRLIEKADNRSSDYAATLDSYSEMLMTKGELDAAEKALRQAAGVYQREENHAALSRIHAHTAELKIERKKYKQAKRELAGARAEALLSEAASAMASEIDATAGWLAVSTGKYGDGVAAYSTSLNECRNQFGEDNAVTGWTYLLLGKAEALNHDLEDASRNMDKGLAILKQSVGTNNIRYIAGELAYSELLEDKGAHTEAARISSAANQTIRNLGAQQCAACTVSVWSLRHQGGF